MTVAGSSDVSSIIYIIPFVLMILPITDLIYVAAGRIQVGRSIFMADKTHLHHRLMRLGLSNSKILFLITGFTATCGLISLLLYSMQTIYGLFLLVSIFVITGIFYYIIKIYERRLEGYSYLNNCNDSDVPKAGLLLQKAP